MTTDITELAQREKFEAWFKSSFHPDKTGPYIKDQLYFAWKAAGAEMVEALEKAQQRISELEAYSKTALEFREAARDENRHLKLSLEAVEGRVIELESRAVTFKLPFTPEPSAYSPWVAKAFYQFHRDTVKSCFAVFSDACAVAGIKVEAE